MNRERLLEIRERAALVSPISAESEYILMLRHEVLAVIDLALEPRDPSASLTYREAWEDGYKSGLERGADGGSFERFLEEHQ